MLRSAGDSWAWDEGVGVCGNAVAAEITMSRAAILFIIFLVSFWGRIRGRQLRPAARSNELLHRADAARLTSAALLSGTRVMAVAAAVCRENVRKRRSEAVLIGVHSIPDSCTELDGIGENADNRT